MRALPFLLAAGLATGAAGDISDEANACIDHLRSVVGATGGEVLGQEASEAATMVRLRDAGGIEYECLVWSGPEIAEFRQVGGEGAGADDGGGAMAGSAETVTGDVRVQFARGSSGARYTNRLGSGQAVSYILGARDGQMLSVQLDPAGPGSAFLNYIIYVPNGDILFESSQAGFDYRGQLWLDGDNRVEVFYNGDPGTFAEFSIDFAIE